MKKALNISISNTLFYIEEDAYQKLERYLKSIRDHFESYSDREEIVADIESRIAEQFSSKGKKVVTIEQIDALIAVMGEANEFGDVTETQANDTSKNTAPESKRLYRNPDDVMIAGVCSGIAAYLGAEATLVRVIFLISLFFGGTGFILYIVLWIAMPEAKTPTEKLQMRGNPVTLESVSEMVKEKADEVKRNADNGTFRKLLEIPAVIIRGIGKFFSRGVFPILGKIIGVILAFAATAAIIGLSIGFFSILINYPSENIDFPLGEMIRGPLYYLTLISGYLAIALPALFFLFVGVGLLRGRSMFNPKFSFPALAVWLIILVVLGVSGVRISALHNEFVRTHPSYQGEERNFEVGNFTAIDIRNGQEVKFVQATSTSVIAEGRRRDLDYLDISVEDGVLVIERREDLKLCLFCVRERPLITVTSPSVEEVKLRNGSNFHAEDITLSQMLLAVTNGSYASVLGEVDSLEAGISNGGDIFLKGTGDTLVANLENGSRLDAKDWNVRSATVEVENASRAELSVSETLSAYAANASRIRYNGSPQVTERIESSSRIENISPVLATSTKERMDE